MKFIKLCNLYYFNVIKGYENAFIFTADIANAC